VLELCRSTASRMRRYYNWKDKYAGMTVAELRRLKELEAESGGAAHANVRRHAVEGSDIWSSAGSFGGFRGYASLVGEPPAHVPNNRRAWLGLCHARRCSARPG
jgi:hypothetical protein